MQLPAIQLQPPVMHILVSILIPLFFLGNLDAKKPSWAQTVCTLPHDSGEACPGKAEEATKAYYFDPVSRKCQTFIYKGCKGNTNTFANSDNCINSCQVPYLVEIEKSEEFVREKLDCLKPMAAGLCKALIPMYYYKKEAKACEKFFWGGCGGNRNQFVSQQECDDFCRGT